MTRSLTPLAAALAAAALAPAGAVAASGHHHADHHPKLGGAPQLRLVDSHHATLTFASDRLPKTSHGRLDARIRFVDGARVSHLKAVRTHGRDIVYQGRVSSSHRLRVHAKYTVRFRLGDSPTVTRKVKVHRAGEHR
jgi:hypothetical protein